MRRQKVKWGILIGVCFWGCAFSDFTLANNIDFVKVNEIREWLNLSKNEISDETLSEGLNLKYQGQSQTYYDYLKTQKDLVEKGRQIYEPISGDINISVGRGIIKSAAKAGFKYTVGELGGPAVGVLAEVLNKAETLAGIAREIAKIFINVRKQVARTYYEGRSMGKTDEEAWKECVEIFPEGLHMDGGMPRKESERNKLHEYVKYAYEIYEISTNPDTIKNIKKDIIEQFPSRMEIHRTQESNSVSAIAQQSTQQSKPEAIKLIKFPETLPPGLPYGQISPEFTKQISDGELVLDSSKFKESTPQSLVNTNYVYHTEKIVGTWVGTPNPTYGYTETFNFYRDSTFVNTSDQGGRYSGTYSIITSGPGAYPFNPMLDFTVTSTNLQGGTFSEFGDYGRGITISGNKMTLETDTGFDNLMWGDYAKQ